MFENAAISLELCKSALMRDGRTEDARALSGLEVLSPGTAMAALYTISGISSNKDETREALYFAKSELKRVLAALTYTLHSAVA
jgi:hypothetical protein